MSDDGDEARLHAQRMALAPPDWLERLRTDASTSELGVSWYEPGTLEPEDEPDHPADSAMHTEATWRHVRENLPHMVLVATGPKYPGYGYEDQAAWYVDSRAPEGLLLAPSSDYAPFLWIPAEGTVDGMRQALGGLFPAPRPTRVTLPNTARGFVGYAHHLVLPHVYSGELVPFNGHDLTRYYTMNGYTGLGAWGSAILDDPNPTEPQPMLALISAGREWLRQSPGVPSLTWRTAASGSYVGFEAHRGRLMVAEARYRPNPNPQVIEKLNAEFGWHFPTDLPVDVVGALLGFGFEPLERIEQELATERDPAQFLGLMEIATALTHGDLDALERLKPYFSHPDSGVRAKLLEFAFVYNLEFLVEELLIGETDEQLAERAHAFLDQDPADVHPDLFEIDPGPDGDEPGAESRAEPGHGSDGDAAKETTHG
jgi:hypothetical protein